MLSIIVQNQQPRTNAKAVAINAARIVDGISKPKAIVAAAHQGNGRDPRGVPLS